MMRRIILLTALMFSIIAYGQIPSYYNNVNLELSGQNLLNELGDKVSETHTTFLSYTPGVWNALKQTDIDPSNSSKVILIYGYNDNDNTTSTDRTRAINDNGGSTGDWNREHVYPKSLGTPNLGTSGPGADAHHLRPSDIARNSSRSNRKFADGSGNSGATAQGHWYPGDEFKGDVARMIMYMYIRYGDRCLPDNVGIGTIVSGDSNMLQLFLEWNVEDPVSTLETQRNPILENIQGNRNPFVDNPAFATAIWGGPQAEDRFGDTGGEPGSANVNLSITFDNYPEETSWEIRNSNNAVVYSGGNYGGQADGSTLNLPVELENGCYSLTFNDTYGDGICCSYGSGSYTLTNSETGSVIASGGEFSSSVTEDFCLESTSLKVNANAFNQTDYDFYPNPVISTISINADENSTYTIFDLSGYTIKTGMVEAEVNLQSLPKGVYLLSFVRGQNTITKMLIKK